MPQISTQEFDRLQLRVHDFLAGVPLHDVWAIDLPRARSGITLDEFFRKASACPCTCTPPALVRALLTIRLFVGRLLGWDREPGATSWETFATRMTAADHSKTLAAEGTRARFFRVVYRFENEQLLELINRTAHPAAERPCRNVAAHNPARANRNSNSPIKVAGLFLQACLGTVSFSWATVLRSSRPSS